MQAIKCCVTVCVMAAIVCGAIGCGKLESGANVVPTVKHRPDSTVMATPDAVETPGSTATTEAGGVGTLTGRVIYEGTFTPLPPLFAKGAATKDPTVCGAEMIPDESIVVNDGGLANVFIYLEKAPKGGKSPEVTGDAVFDQKTCIFLPHAFLVRTKQTVLVKNDDAAAHNTHTNPLKNKGFNSVIAPNDRVGVPLTYAVAEKQPLSVVCDIHAWMRAYHLPLDHSFADVSKADGTFEIKDLPAGKHEFKVWHEKGEFLEKSRVVIIKPGEKNEITINVSAAKLSK